MPEAKGLRGGPRRCVGGVISRHAASGEWWIFAGRSGAGRGDWHTGKRAGRKREGKGKGRFLGEGGWVYY